MSSTRSLFGRAWRELSRHPRRSLMVAVAVGLCVCVIGVARLIDRNVETATESWGGGVQMIVFLDEGVDDERVDSIAGVLRDLPAVSGVDYVSPEVALSRLEQSLGEHPELASGLESQMMPASLEVSLAAGVKDVAGVHPVVERLRTTAGVSSVEFVGEWVDRLDTLVAGVERGASGVFLLVAFFGCVLVGAISRLGIARDRVEDDILHLVGASEAFARTPRILSGAALGFGGAILGLVLLWALFVSSSGSISTLLVDTIGSGRVRFLPGADAILLVGLGALWGTVGATMARADRARA